MNVDHSTVLYMYIHGLAWAHYDVPMLTYMCLCSYSCRIRVARDEAAAAGAIVRAVVFFFAIDAVLSRLLWLDTVFSIFLLHGALVISHAIDHISDLLYSICSHADTTHRVIV